MSSAQKFSHKRIVLGLTLHLIYDQFIIFVKKKNNKINAKTKQNNEQP